MNLQYDYFWLISYFWSLLWNWPFALNKSFPNFLFPEATSFCFCLLRLKVIHIIWFQVQNSLPFQVKGFILHKYGSRSKWGGANLIGFSCRSNIHAFSFIFYWNTLFLLPFIHFISQASHHVGPDERQPLLPRWS